MVTSSAVVARRRLAASAACDRHGDHDPLAHATGEIVRILVDAACGSGMRTQIEQLDGAGPRAPSRQTYRGAAHLAICAPMDSTGLSEVIGSWKIMRDLACRGPRASRCDERQRDRVPSNRKRPAAMRAGRKQAHQRERRQGLAGARTPDQRQLSRRLAWRSEKSAHGRGAGKARSSGRRLRGVLSGHRSDERGFSASFSPSPRS